MTDNQLLYVYFCLEQRSRKVVAAFSEYRKGSTDERYVKRAFHPQDGSKRTEWLPVEGAPIEMTSRKFDVYSQSVTPFSADHEFGFLRALELFAVDELDEEFLQEGSTFIPHR